VSLLATERNKIQLAWEEDYINKVNFWHEVDLLVMQDRAAVSAASSSNANPVAQLSMTGNAPSTVVNLQDMSAYATLAGTQTLNDSQGGRKEIVAGTFTVPENIQPVTISGGKVNIPKGITHREYAKARVTHTEKTKAAGFMAISTDLYTFAPGAEEGNVFAPDFIPILVLLHSKIVHLWKSGKVKANSGYRWWNETDGVEYSFHEAGCAIDIGTRDPDGSINTSRSYAVADAAWELGLRDVHVAQSFVHIDLGPDGGGYSYNLPKYRGPESH
jgi:hypothetical protein